MGLFSSSKVVSVSNTTVNLTEEENLPRTLQDAVLHSVLSGDDLSEDLLIAQLTNYSTKVRKYLAYGKKNPHGYISGLPEGFTVASSPNEDLVQSIITAEVNPASGRVIQIVSNYIDEVDVNYIAYAYLQKKYNWNLQENLLIKYGRNYTLTDIELVYPDSGDVHYYTDRVTISLTFRTSSYPYSDTKENIYLNDGIKGDYYQVIYRDTILLPADPGTKEQQHIGLWNGAPSVGQILEVTVMGQYQTFIEGIDFTSEVTAAAAIRNWINATIAEINASGSNTTVVMDWVDVGEQPVSIVNTSVGAMNISTAVIVAGTYPQGDVYEDAPNMYWIYDIESNATDDPYYPELVTVEETPYVAEFYPIALLRTNFRDTNREKLDDNGDPYYVYPELYASVKKLLGKIDVDADAIIDSISENKDIDDIKDAFILFALDLAVKNETCNDYLYRFFKDLEPKSGVGKLRYEAAKEADKIAPVNVFEIRESNYNTKIYYNYIESRTVVGSIGDKGTVTKTITKLSNTVYNPPYDDDGNNLTYYRGITYLNSYVTFKYQATEGSYEELIIRGLKSYTRIGGENTTIYLGGKSAFLIPINTVILSKFSGLKEEVILFLALKMTIYTYHEEKVKWYQSSFFKIFVTVIMVVIAIYTGYFDPEAFAAMLAGQSTTAVLVTLLKKVLVSFAINYAVSWIASKIGGLGGLLFSMAVMFVMPTQFGGMGGSMKGLPWAENLMKAVMSTMGNMNKEMALEMADIADEFADLSKSIQERAEEFEEAEAMLAYGNISNPLYMLNAAFYFDPNETPSSFFDRTLQTNAGVVSLDAIEYYADNMLRLPEANAPFSENEYGLSA